MAVKQRNRIGNANDNNVNPTGEVKIGDSVIRQAQKDFKAHMSDRSGLSGRSRWPSKDLEEAKKNYAEAHSLHRAKRKEYANKYPNGIELGLSDEEDAERRKVISPMLGAGTEKGIRQKEIRKFITPPKGTAYDPSHIKGEIERHKKEAIKQYGEGHDMRIHGEGKPLRLVSQRNKLSKDDK